MKSKENLLENKNQWEPLGPGLFGSNGSNGSSLVVEKNKKIQYNKKAIWGCNGFDTIPEVGIASSGWSLRPL